MTKAWFVATTKHRQEFLARKNLREQGYEVYLPKVFFHPNDGQKKPHGLRFPGYIFITFDPDLDDWVPINHTRGIDGSGLMLRTDKSPQALRRGYVGRLQQIEDDDLERAIERDAEPRDDLRDGDEVQINNPDHYLHGQIGRYMETIHGSAWVLIAGKKCHVPEADLKKMAKPVSNTKAKAKRKVTPRKIIQPESKAA